MNRIIFKIWLKLQLLYAFLEKLYNQQLDSVYDECKKLNKGDKNITKLNLDIEIEITRRNK